MLQWIIDHFPPFYHQVCLCVSWNSFICEDTLTLMKLAFAKVSLSIIWMIQQYSLHHNMLTLLQCWICINIINIEVNSIAVCNGCIWWHNGSSRCYQTHLVQLVIFGKKRYFLLLKMWKFTPKPDSDLIITVFFLQVESKVINTQEGPHGSLFFALCEAWSFCMHCYLL